MTCGDMVGPPRPSPQGPRVEPAYLLLCITCCACLGGACGTEGHGSGVTSATQESRQEQWGGLTKWGRQGFLAEDLLVQLLCLLVLVLFQVC